MGGVLVGRAWVVRLPGGGLSRLEIVLPGVLRSLQVEGLEVAAGDNLEGERERLQIVVSLPTDPLSEKHFVSSVTAK